MFKFLTNRTRIVEMNGEHARTAPSPFTRLDSFLFKGEPDLPGRFTKRMNTDD